MLGPGELACPLRRLDVVEADDSALGLGDHLLRDHDDVALAELDPGGDHRAQIVALVDLGQALDRQDRDHASGTPVMRIPAWAL